jgi:putative flippase GtrA
MNAPAARIVRTPRPPGPRSAWTRARRLADETWKYFLVSLIALGVDYGLLVSLTEVARLHYLISAAVGFAAGLVVNYALSVAFVFRQHRLKSRRLEFIGFFVIGALGLALNEFSMKLLVESLGLAYALAKIPAMGVSFMFNFGARKILLFTARDGNS